MSKDGIIVLLLVCLAGVGVSTGCTTSPGAFGRWVADYDSAENEVRLSGRELLIAFVETRLGRTATSLDVLDNAAIRARIDGYVNCRLFKAYEPDRRYVAQYGVERTPAIIIVHADGTFHSWTGPMSVENVTRFLDDATAPGAEPVVNIHIPRQARYEWHDSVTTAEQESKDSGKDVLYVFHRKFSNDWRRLEKILAKREVHMRFSGMVHCRVGTINPWAKAYDTQFGSVALPAIVIADSDGAYDILEMPTSSESVAGFVDRFIGRSAVSGTRSTASAVRP